MRLNYGKLRNQVVKITQPGGKYEVKTPNAVIGVIGTDFYVAYDNNRTTVICYEGQLDSYAGGGRQGPIATTPATAQLRGQMVVVGAEGSSTAWNRLAAPPAVMQASMSRHQHT